MQLLQLIHTTQYLLSQNIPAVVVRIIKVNGSTPQNAGVWLIVTDKNNFGTIGGGHLEWLAIDHARVFLNNTNFSEPIIKNIILGAQLGQCCGGRVALEFFFLDTLYGSKFIQSQGILLHQYPHIAIFGAGHVGMTLLEYLIKLPTQVSVFDSRESFIDNAKNNIITSLANSIKISDNNYHHNSIHIENYFLFEYNDPIHPCIATLAANSYIIIATHDHLQDFDCVRAALERQRNTGDIAFIGLIGSRTKWANFKSRLLARGFSESELSQVVCPIGIAGIYNKAPGAIALAIAAQLMQIISKNDRYTFKN